MNNYLYGIIKELENNTSILKKLEILEREKNTETLKRFFRYALEPKLVYGIKKNPMPETSNPDLSGGYAIDAMFQLLDRLASRELTGNEAISTLKALNERLDQEDRYLLDCMIQKNPRCGVSKAIISKVWPSLLSNEIKLCKAQPYSEKNMSRIKYPAVSQRKCDGARCLAFVSGDNVTFFSSNGIVYQKIGEYLSEEALKYGRYYPTDEPLTDYVLDGELLVEIEGKVLPRKRGNGILNKALKGTISDEEADFVRMVVWDMIPIEDYELGYNPSRYNYIFETIMSKSILNNHIRVCAVESKLVKNKAEALKHFQEMLERGEEGTILKSNDFTWENKRSTKCVKMKVVIDTTLKITGKFVGNEKYAGMLGGIICESADGKVVVNVGSGFSDADRESLWENDITGKFVEIRSNGIIANEAGTYSLFLPRFVEFRNDKEEADSYETIVALSDGSKMLSN